MSCKTYGWRGHRYVNGICDCKITKKKAETQRLIEQIHDTSDYGLYIKFFIFAGILMVSVFLLLPIFTSFINDVLNAPSVPEEYSSDNQLLNDNNTTVGPSFSLPFPFWPIFIVIAITGSYYVLRLIRGGEY